MIYPVHNQQGEKISDIELAEKVFAVASKEALIHQAMIAQQNNERQVLADTKDRSEVRGGGKKPWKQKGTGRARVGSSRSPLWIGGGVTFGPTSGRNFSVKLNDKMRRKALLAVLSDRAATKAMIVLDGLTTEDGKTKAMNAILGKLLDMKKKSVLVINDLRDAKISQSLRNLVGVEVINLDNINILSLLKNKNLILTVEVVKALEKIYAK